MIDINRLAVMNAWINAIRTKLYSVRNHGCAQSIEHYAKVSKEIGEFIRPNKNKVMRISLFSRSGFLNQLRKMIVEINRLPFQERGYLAIQRDAYRYISHSLSDILESKCC